MAFDNTNDRSILADELGIEADKDGRCTISIRGAAKLLGVTKSSIRKRISNPWDHEALGPLQEADVCGTQGELKMFPEGKPMDDQTFTDLVIWYSSKSPRKRTKEAIELLALTASIGVRGWLQVQAGHDGKVSELVQSVAIDRLDMEAAIDEAVLERLVEANKARSIAQAKLKNDYDRGLENLRQVVEVQGKEIMRLRYILDKDSPYDAQGNRLWTAEERAKKQIPGIAYRQ